MKYLKYILGLIAILVIGFFLLGLINSEIAYKCEIVANKPLAESWAVSQDEEKLSDWLEGFQKTKHISGTPGTVGAVSDIYFTDNGQDMVIRETITKIVPNQSISMLFTSDFMNMDYELTMKTENDKTKINSNTVCKGNGAFSKSLIALMKSSFKKQEETNLSLLKKTIENNSKDYSLIKN